MEQIGFSQCKGRRRGPNSSVDSNKLYERLSEWFIDYKVNVTITTKGEALRNVKEPNHYQAPNPANIASMLGQNEGDLTNVLLFATPAH